MWKCKWQTKKLKCIWYFLGNLVLFLLTFCVILSVCPYILHDEDTYIKEKKKHKKVSKTLIKSSRRLNSYDTLIFEFCVNIQHSWYFRWILLKWCFLSLIYIPSLCKILGQPDRIPTNESKHKISSENICINCMKFQICPDFLWKT